MRNNTIRTENGSLAICGGQALAAYQRDHPGKEVGTRVEGWPSDEELIEQARSLLGE